MSPTRRDLFKIAAGLGLTGIVPTTAERIAAAEALKQPVSTNPVLDPASFADEADRLLETAMEERWLSLISPEAHVAERKALKAFEAEHPEIALGKGITAFSDYQEAVFWLALSLYTAGLKHGAAYEHLRRSRRSLTDNRSPRRQSRVRLGPARCVRGATAGEVASHRQ